jgi:pimeloyl-ACP methyl ester carboxylesterase
VQQPHDGLHPPNGVFFWLMHSVVFVHGGPGLTTVPERRRFGKDLEASGVAGLFWNEPAPSRPEGPPFSPANAFESAVASLRTAVDRLDRPVFVAHSFGAHYLLNLPRAVLERARHIVLISPTLLLNDTLRRIIASAARHFDAEEPEKASRTRDLLARSEQFFDKPMEDAVQLALTDPQLLPHQWRDPVAAGEFFAVLQEPGAGFDVDCLFAVLRRLTKVGAGDLSRIGAIPTPATLIIGDEDPVLDQERVTESARRIFPGVEVRGFPGAGHYPHLERPPEFLRLLLDAVNAQAAAGRRQKTRRTGQHPTQ